MLTTRGTTRAPRGASIILALVALTACGRAPVRSEPENVFGPDNRQTVPDGRPYAAIGRLDSGCTGTLIGKRLALTAAHCVVDGETGTVKPEVGYFRPALKNGASTRPVWIDYVWLGSLQPEENRLKDCAVVRLAEPVGEEFGHLGAHVVQFALPYTTSLAGYSRDLDQGNNSSVHRGCYIHEIVDGRLFHDCDATAGISGAPMLNLINGNTYIVALSVSEFRQGAADSVRRESYSREYANVAIPASAFASVVTKLLETADVGVPAPSLDGVAEKANPNSVPNGMAAGGETGSGADDARLFTASDVSDQASLSADSTGIRAAFAELRSQIRRLRASAFNAGADDLAVLVEDLGANASELDAGVSRAVTSRVASGHREHIYERYNSLRASESRLLRFDPARLPSRNAVSIEAAMADVTRALQSVEALIFSR